MAEMEGNNAKQPDVSTAWLLLSHAGWLALSMSCLALSAFIDNVNLSHETKRAPKGRNLALGSAGLAVLSAIWTLYAVITTWIANTKVSNPVYGHLGFTLVMALALFVAALSLWSLIVLATD